MKATHKLTEGKTNRQLANMALKAMSLLIDYSCGTVKNPCELPSIQLNDGRSIIETIYQDGFIRYNDGWYIVEVDEYSMYIDYTGYALNEMGNPEYEIVSDFEEVFRRC